QRLDGILARRGPLEKDRHDKIALYLRHGLLNEERLARGELSSGRLAELLRQADSELPVEDSADIASIAPASDDEPEVGEPALDELLPRSEAPESEAPESDAQLEAAASEEREDATTASDTDAEEAAPAAQAKPALEKKYLEAAVTYYRVVFDSLEPENEDAIAGLTRV